MRPVLFLCKPDNPVICAGLHKLQRRLLAHDTRAPIVLSRHAGCPPDAVRAAIVCAGSAYTMAAAGIVTDLLPISNVRPPRTWYTASGVHGERLFIHPRQQAYAAPSLHHSYYRHS